MSKRKVVFGVSLACILAGLGFLCFELRNAKDTEEILIVSRDRMEEVLPEDEEPSDAVPPFSDFGNPEVLAYLHVPDQGISYPVAQSTDNQYYLKHNVYGRYDFHGTLFLDYRNASDFSSPASVIYGHNMKNNTMFGWLDNVYWKSIEGRSFVIETRTELLTYDVLCTTLVDKDDGQVYFMQEGDSTQSFAEGLRSESVKYVEAYTDSITPESKFVTLLTCFGDGKKYRFGVTGLLRERQEK